MNVERREAEDFIENRTFDEIKVGDEASLQRRLTMNDIKLFAVMSGDVNPAHVDEDYAESSRFHEVVAHGMWGGSLLSTLLGTQLPGPGTIYVSQTLEFQRPVTLGDLVTVEVKVVEKAKDTGRVTLDCACRNQAGKPVITGTAEVLAPTEKIRRPRWAVPEVQLAERVHLHRLLKDAAECPTRRMAVVHPVEEQSIKGVLAAVEMELIEPILVGPEDRIREAAEACEVDISGFRLVPTPHSHAAAQAAVNLARKGEVDALMKGSLHTDELLLAVIDRNHGLRTERRISHVFAFDVPTYRHALFITDAAINVNPGLMEKRDIVQNAIDLAHALQIPTPKVAILSAVETVAEHIPSTLDAAALCKMADRGQIQGGIVDGPLAFDNAVSSEAARIKGIESPVAGRADILVTPELNSGNMLAKQLEYLAGATGSGIVMGAKVPIVLTSRADDAITRMASCALATMVLEHRQREPA